MDIRAFRIVQGQRIPIPYSKLFLCLSQFQGIRPRIFHLFPPSPFISAIFAPFSCLTPPAPPQKDFLLALTSPYHISICSSCIPSPFTYSLNPPLDSLLSSFSFLHKASKLMSALRNKNPQSPSPRYYRSHARLGACG